MIDRYATLRIGPFRAFLGMKLLITFGLQMQAVVIGYHLYSITQDALSLGLIGLAEALPAMTFGLYGGYIADRSDKRKLLAWVVAATALVSAAIWLGSLPASVAALGPKGYQWFLYGMIVLGGIGRGFYSPAAFSLMSLLVPRDLYANSATWNSVVWQAGTVLGPTLGGFLYAAGGPVLAFGVVVAFVVGSLLCLLGVGAQPSVSTAAQRAESIPASIAAGWRFVFSQNLLLGAIAVDMFSVFFGGVVALLPIYAHDILKVGAEGMGALRAADAVGSVAMMLVLARYPPTGRPWRNLLLAVAAFGLAILAFGASTNFYFSLACLVALGAADAISVVIRSTIIQTLTPEAMRGRVASVNSIFIASSNEIGAFESGLTARWMGAVPATFFGGTMTLLVVGATAWLTRGYIAMRGMMAAPLPQNEAAEKALEARVGNAA